MTSFDTASPTLRFWASAIGIAAFPLLVISIAYGLRAFSLLPPATPRSGPGHFLLFGLGLLLAEGASVLHGAIALAWTHPQTHALAPPIAVTLLLGLLPVALCIYAVDQRIERGWGVAALLLLGFILANPAVLLIGRMLVLPTTRSW
jgi:hypothetical protein